MRASRILLNFCAAVLLTAATARAQVASLGKGWLLDVAGSITSAPAEVISGSNSVKGSYGGANTFTPFLLSDPTFIQFTPNHTYTITFSYRILTAGTSGFSVAFETATGDVTQDYGPGTIFNGSSGTSGTETFRAALKSYSDYQVGFRIVGTGTIVVDDIRVTDSTGQVVASENAEGPTLVPGPLNFMVTDATTFLTEGNSTLRTAAIHDLNGDGHPETVLTFEADRPAEVPLHPIVIESSTGLKLATSDFFPGGVPTLKSPSMTLFTDINNDGIPDVLLSDAGSDPTGPGSAIGIGLSLGGGKYLNVQPLIPADQQTTRSQAIAAGDVLSDGHVEIILPDEKDGANTALLRWNGNGFDEIRNWVPLSLWKFGPYYMRQQSGMVLSDFDQDGKQDLLVTGQSNNPNFQILFGAAGGFSAGSLVVLPDGPFGHVPPPFPDSILHTTAEVSPVIVADFNNDGKPDIFAIEREEYIYPAGVYTDTNDPSYASVLANGGVVPVNSTFQIFINQGARLFTDVSSASTLSNLGRREYSELFPIDINNDGFLDVVGVYEHDLYAHIPAQWGTTLFLNDGTGAFQVVDGADVLAAVTTTPSNGSKWNLGSFVPTVVNPGRTEGIVYDQLGGCNGPGGCPARSVSLYKVVANGTLGTGPNFVDPATLGVPGFNEFYYLRHYPDAAAAVQAGQYQSGLAHYLAIGAAKGYQPHAPNGIVAVQLAALPLNSTGTATTTTPGTSPVVSAGYATAILNSGTAPFATAVFGLSQNGVVVSEAGVPASSPIQNARLFIDYRTSVAAGSGTVDVNTGVAIANANGGAASLTFILRDQNGQTITTGHGTLQPNAHRAKFVNELKDIAPDFAVPTNFPTTILFGSLEIDSSQPLSVLGLRLTVNQRGETLLTSTSVADLSKTPVASDFYFPQFVDGGGYSTSIILSNTSGATETGTISIMDDNGGPLTVGQVGGSSVSSFPYSIPAGGVFVFQSDGSPTTIRTGWVRVAPDSSTSPPAGLGIFSVTAEGILVTQSGIPSALPTLHARIYVDMSNGHDSGIALANPGNSPIKVAIQTFRGDGTTTASASGINIAGNGHTAAFVDQLVAGLPNGFTGLADFTSATPFVLLTLRTLTNARGDFLLTTFPAPDVTTPAPAPIVFPQVADGGGFTTEFIFIPANAAASISLDLIPDAVTPMVGSGGP